MHPMPRQRKRPKPTRVELRITRQNGVGLRRGLFLFFPSRRFLHRHMQHRDWMVVVANSPCLSLFGAEFALFWDFRFLAQRRSARPIAAFRWQMHSAPECPFATHPGRHSLIACHNCFSSRIPTAYAAISILSISRFEAEMSYRDRSRS